MVLMYVDDLSAGHGKTAELVPFLASLGGAALVREISNSRLMVDGLAACSVKHAPVFLINCQPTPPSQPHTAYHSNFI